MNFAYWQNPRVLGEGCPLARKSTAGLQEPAGLALLGEWREILSTCSCFALLSPAAGAGSDIGRAGWVETGQNWSHTCRSQVNCSPEPSWLLLAALPPLSLPHPFPVLFYSSVKSDRVEATGKTALLWQRNCKVGLAGGGAACAAQGTSPPAALRDPAAPLPGTETGRPTAALEGSFGQRLGIF